MTPQLTETSFGFEKGNRPNGMLTWKCSKCGKKQPTKAKALQCERMHK